MANVLYGLGRERFLGGDLDWDAHTIFLALVTTSYTPNTTTDEFYDNVPGGAVTAESGAFSGKTKTLGVADASDVTLTAVSGSASAYLVIARDTTVDSTSPLIALIDTATGLPVTPNGGDITVQWDNGANKIFKLFETLSDEDREKVGHLQRLLDFMKWGWDRTRSGLWVPQPTVVPAPVAATSTLRDRLRLVDQALINRRSGVVLAH